VLQFDCEICGKFQIKAALSSSLSNDETDNVRLLRPALSAYTRQRSEAGIATELDEDNWRRAAESHRQTAVSDKIRKLLAIAGSKTQFAGDPAMLYPYRDFPLIDSVGEDEMVYLLKSLLASDYLSLQWPASVDEITARQCNVIVTVKGWEQLQPLGRGAGIPGRCFVAMSFDKSLDGLYTDGIEGAIRDCGYMPVRLDRENYNENINDRMLAEIRLAQFIVADFTGQKHGVYFEAGFALALGRPVMWLCSENDFKNVHFDTNHYNHIVWRDATDLRQKLADRIRATIGDRR